MSLTKAQIDHLTQYVKIGDKINGDFIYHSNKHNYNDTRTLNLFGSHIGYKDIIAVSENNIVIMSMSDLYRRVSLLETENKTLKEKISKLEISNTM